MTTAERTIRYALCGLLFLALVFVMGTCYMREVAPQHHIRVEGE